MLLSCIQGGLSDSILAALIFRRAVATLGVSLDRCLSNTLVVLSSGGMLLSLLLTYSAIMKVLSLDQRNWYVVRAVLQSVLDGVDPSFACLSAASFPDMSRLASVHFASMLTPLTCRELMSSRQVRS